MNRRVEIFTRIMFIAPGMLIVVALLAYPVASSIYFSFTNKNLLIPESDVIGWANFQQVLVDPEFWNAFRNSIKWTAGSLLGQLLVGFVCAIALQRIPRFSGVFRTLLIIPWAFPAIVIAFGWRWILNDVYGFLPNLLTSLGLTDMNVSLLADPATVFWVVIAINIWFGSPLFMVNILAALKTVPSDQLEAALVDGATAVQRFTYVTLPHISRVIGLLVILRTIWIFNNFELLFLLTGGGPASQTTTMPIFAYRAGWGMYQLGIASAITVLVLVFLMAIVAVGFRIIERTNKVA